MLAGVAQLPSETIAQTVQYCQRLIVWNCADVDVEPATMTKGYSGLVLQDFENTLRSCILLSQRSESNCVSRFLFRKHNSSNPFQVTRPRILFNVCVRICFLTSRSQPSLSKDELLILMMPKIDPVPVDGISHVRQASTLLVVRDLVVVTIPRCPPHFLTNLKLSVLPGHVRVVWGDSAWMGGLVVK